MDNASLSRKAPNVSELAVDDIPEAVRDIPQVEAEPRRPQKKWLILRLVALGAIALATSVWLHFQSEQFRTSSFASQTQQDLRPATPALSSPAVSPATATNAGKQVPADNLLGHLPYEEAPADELQSIAPDGSIKLRKAAAAKYQEMVNAAASEGVSLVPISAFRSVADQQHVFFDVKAERGQNATKRAEVSAPPGYSEHHTGYAIDIGDGNAPETNLSQTFETTKAFKWLQARAPYFSFEISFPKDNPQGVSYEPWHWRFVGDRHSLETFYRAHSLKK
ncbi:MAG: D-alanyl-D-alanine carboxypeptidase family protein [Actinomycetota bacterium]